MITGSGSVITAVIQTEFCSYQKLHGQFGLPMKQFTLYSMLLSTAIICLVIALFIQVPGPTILLLSFIAGLFARNIETR